MSDAPGPAREDAAKPVADESGDLVFDTLWDRTIAAWEDDDAHAKMLDYALRSEKLAILASRYRRVADEDVERQVRAQKKLDALVAAATQMLFAMKTPEPQKVSRSFTIIVALICAATVAWLGVKILGRP